MMLKNLKLDTANISRFGRTGRLEAVGTGIARKRSESGNMTREPESYLVECAAFHGDILKVKIPLTASNSWRKLEEVIKAGNTALVKFEGLTLRPYAMTTGTGAFLSGVSGRADSFQIVEVIDNDMADIPIDE